MFRSYAQAGVSAGASTAPSVGRGSSAAAGPGGWHPTVLYMLALVVGEIVIAGWLSRHLLG